MKNCEYCGKELLKNGVRFCSRACSNKSGEKRKRMSTVHKGVLGYKHSAESKEKMSIVNKERIFSEETRKKMSIVRKGHPVSEETRKKISIGNKGKVRSEETRKKLSVASKGNQYHKGHKHSEETRKKMSIVRKGKIRTMEHCKNMSIAHKKLWEDPDYATKMMKAQGVSPNKQELYLNSLLQQWFPNEWKFVGDGQVWFNGKCPDFINVNGKKQIIELFGDYWHKDDIPEDRVKLFEPYGFSTLVIWEKELKNKNVLELKNKIQKFCSRALFS